MSLPVRIGFWISLSMTGLLCQSATPVEIFPWDAKHHISPDRRFAVYNAAVHSRDEGLQGHMLLIQELKTSAVRELGEYSAYAQLLWSPKCTGLIINNHIGSNIETTAVFLIHSDSTGIHVSKDPAFELNPNPFPNDEISDEYLWGLRWLNDRQYIVEHRWITESTPYREVTERYRITVGKGTRLISRKIKPPHSLGRVT